MKLWQVQGVAIPFSSGHHSYWKSRRVFFGVSESQSLFRQVIIPTGRRKITRCPQAGSQSLFHQVIIPTSLPRVMISRKSRRNPFFIRSSFLRQEITSRPFRQSSRNPFFIRSSFLQNGYEYKREGKRKSQSLFHQVIIPTTS